VLVGTSRARLETQIRFFAPFAPRNATILEIGCATGELALATREMVSVARYEAIELSPAGEQAKPISINCTQRRWENSSGRGKFEPHST